MEKFKTFVLPTYPAVWLILLAIAAKFYPIVVFTSLSLVLILILSSLLQFKIPIAKKILKFIGITADVIVLISAAFSALLLLGFKTDAPGSSFFDLNFFLFLIPVIIFCILSLMHIDFLSKRK